MLSTGSTSGLDRTIQSIGTVGRYNAFGTLFATTGSTIKAPYRSGASHLTGGRVEWDSYNASTKVWNGPTTIYTAPTNQQTGDVKGGVVGGEKIMLFTTRITDVGGTNTFLDFGYLLSTDISGTSWGSFTTLPLPTGVTAYQPYGNLVATNTAGTYYQPAYGLNAGGTVYVVWLYKIVYSAGVPTISIIEMYRGSSAIVETCIEHLGSGKYIALGRVNGRNVLTQMTSSDDGLTWSAPTDTNMGTGASGGGTPVEQMADVKLVNGTLICLFQNRSTTYLQVGKVAYSGTLPGATAWTVTNYYLNTPPVGGNGFALGYPSMCFLPGSTSVLLISWAAENSTTDTRINTRQEDFN